MIKRIGKLLILCGLIGTFISCESLLEVQDPSRFTDSDLDQALEAVARGTEGMLQLSHDYYVNVEEILSDVYSHTGTWAGWDDLDHGLMTWDVPQSDGGDDYLEARYAAIDARARFDRLAAEGQTVSPLLYAQVEATEAWANLLVGMHACEGVGDPTFPDWPDLSTYEYATLLTDMGMYQLAVDKFTTAIATAQAAGDTEHERWATAGRARANLLLSNYAAALTDAQAIPDGWVYEAIYDQATSGNYIVSISTFGYNHASGIRHWLVPRVDDVTHLLRDAYTNEPDPRVPIYHEPGTLGVDGVTEYYSQWKYNPSTGGESSNIPITHSEEMRLIEAEVHWRQGNLAQAVTVLNGLRAAAGLTAVTATTSQEVFDLLLNERFAELYMEGQRFLDIHRFGLAAQYIASGHFLGGTPPRDSEPVRPTKFPFSDAEALNNPNIEPNSSQRCLFTSAMAPPQPPS